MSWAFGFLIAMVVTLFFGLVAMALLVAHGQREKAEVVCK